MARKQWLSVGELTLEGYVNGDGVTVFAENASQLALLCGKAGAPTAYTGAGYAIGCHYVNATNGALYYNAGTAAIASWSAIGTMTTSSVTTAMVQANAVTPIKMGTRTLVGLSNGNATPTIAQLMTSSVFTMTPTAARTFTTPTAALMVAGVTGATVGSWFDFTIVNLSATTAAYGITLTAGDAGVTLVGSPIVYSGSGTFRAVLTNVTGSSEALSIYRMDDAVPAVLTGVTAGTQAAGKAVIANSDVNIGVVKATGLYIGSTGSETQVTATAAEINTACDQSGQVLTAGAGFAGAGTIYKTSVVKQGDIFKTTILIDLTGAASSTTDLDIIGTSGVSHIGQITAALNGTLFFGQITCLETPAGGIDDIDVYSATEGTGAFDAGIAALTETAMLTKGGAWTAAAATQTAFATLPAANSYMYLTGGAGGTAGTYTAGQFMIELWGV